MLKFYFFEYIKTYEIIKLTRQFRNPNSGFFRAQGQAEEDDHLKGMHVKFLCLFATLINLQTPKRQTHMHE
jgi:hypothetical protein